LFARGTVSPAS